MNRKLQHSIKPVAMNVKPQKRQHVEQEQPRLQEDVSERRFSEFDDDDEIDGGDEDIACFNREWWRSSCQMSPPASGEYARHIRLVYTSIAPTQAV
jgi:hypothetical protein